MLQIELISHTKILAHGLTHTETGTWVVVSRSNMGLALGNPDDKAGTDWAIDPNLWNAVPLPNSVAPSFETCNIERRYELEIRVGLTHGTPGNMKVFCNFVLSVPRLTRDRLRLLTSIQPQLIVLPLRMPVKIYSGIAPPQALLDAMAAAAVQPSQSKPTHRPTWPTSSDSNDPPPMPPRPAGPVPVSADSSEAYDDAPPSYEDAMAENLSPVDGPRREYHPPDASSSRSMESGADAKSPVETGRTHEGPVPGPQGSLTPSAYEPQGRSSSESFDMLPTTPPESISGSPPGSPVRRSQSMMKVHRNPMDDESPPQYQPVADGQLQAPSNSIRQRPSQNSLRPMNLGVPSRKPAPGPSRRPTT